jgi:prepilin peptidase dependent protein B
MLSPDMSRSPADGRMPGEGPRMSRMRGLSPDMSRQRVRSGRGFSIIELMIGTTAGLLLVASSVAIFGTQLAAAHHTRLEVRINQDLRAAADVVARDLRRASFWQDAIQGTVASGWGSATTTNPYRDISASGGTIAYRFSRDGIENNTLDGNEQFGFRVHTDQSLQMQTADGTWISLTDPDIVRITSFAITPDETTLALGDLCPTSCAAGTPNCPTITVRSYNVLLAGEAVSDSAVRRELRLAVRVRNDRLEGACPV